MSSNSKEFRENVKNDCLKAYSDLLISKYVCEEVTGKQQLMNNRSTIEQIEKLYESVTQVGKNLKSLYDLLFKTRLGSYYQNFFECSRYKKCKESDICKYIQKLNKTDLNKEKRNTFIEVYSLKYEGIAKSYFS